MLCYCYDAIIFDFDGVIVESVNIKTESFAEIYRPYGSKVVEKVVQHHLANGGMSRFEKFRLYQKEFLGKELFDDELSEITDRFSRLVTNRVIEAPYVEGAIEFIESYCKIFDLFVSSATPKKELREIIYRRKITKYFREIFGSPESKSKQIRKILKKYKYEAIDLVFIGDATNDKEAASENNINFIWRFTDNVNILTDNHPYIFDLTSLEKRIKDY